MISKVIIASDSTSDLNAELIEKNGIKIIPLGVTLGEEQYIDGVDVDPDMIYAHYEKTGELPKTSAVNIDAFSAFFEEYTSQGYEIVVFTISASMSSTYHNACLAAEDFEGVCVVDTKNLSTGGGLLVLHACEMARDGRSAREIAAECEALCPNVDASFVIDSLEFLYKGGRCTALAMLGANLLQLKPCITVDNGKMEVGKKYRGRFADVLKKYVCDRVGDGTGIRRDHVFVTHAGCDDQIYTSCVEQVRTLMPDASIHVTRAGCTISSHCGRNTLGVLFIKE